MGNFLTSCRPVSFSRRPLHHGVSKYLYTDEVFTTFKLDGENPPGVLSEVETCSCSPLNRCDTKSCSDGISMLIATTLLMYKVDYNKL